MSAALNLSENDFVLWNDARWVVNSVDQLGVVMSNARVPNAAPRHFEHTFLQSARNDGRLKIIVSDGGIAPATLSRSEQREADMLRTFCEQVEKRGRPFGKLPEHEQTRGIKYNSQVIARRVLDEYGFTDTKTFSKSKIGRILEHYRDTGGDFEALVIKTRKRQGKPLPAEVEAFVKWCIKSWYLAKNKPTESFVYKMMKEKAPDGIAELLPSESSFRRRIDGLNKALVIKHREGEAALKEYLRGSGKSIKTDYIMERVEMDAMHITLGVKDDDGNFLGYFTVYFAVDFKSRSVVGWHIEVKKKLTGKESAAAVMACFKNMLDTRKPKGSGALFCLAGIPDEVVMDHGTAYANTAIRKLCKKLGISIQYTGTKRGWGKPVAEAFVKCLRGRFFKNIKGYRHTKYLKKVDSTRPEHENCVKLSELKLALEDFVNNGYQKRKHEGLDFDTPQRVWDKHYKTLPPRLADSVDRQLFKTKVRTYKVHYVLGVRKDGQTFNSNALKNWYVGLDTTGNKSSSIPFDVHFDPEDASEIVVVHPKTGECLTVPNTNIENTIGKSFIEANAKKVANKARPDESDEFSCHQWLSKNPKKKRKVNRPHTEIPMDDGSQKIDLQKIMDDANGDDERLTDDDFLEAMSADDEDWGA